MSLTDTVCSEEVIKVRMAIFCHFSFYCVWTEYFKMHPVELQNVMLIGLLFETQVHQEDKLPNLQWGTRHILRQNNFPYFLWVLTVRIWVSCLTPSTGLEKDGCKTKLKFRLRASQSCKEQSQELKPTVGSHASFLIRALEDVTQQFWALSSFLV